MKHAHFMLVLPVYSIRSDMRRGEFRAALAHRIVEAPSFFESAFVDTLIGTKYSKRPPDARREPDAATWESNASAAISIR